MTKIFRHQRWLFGAALVIAGCSNGDGKVGLQQTGLAGHLTAGGSSSGEVIKHAKEVTRSTAPAGTPGIPQGAGGTTSGAALGGTTTGVKQQEDKAKQALADSMEAVSSRWRSRAVANGWKAFPPVSVAAVEGFNASAGQSSANGQPGGQLGGQAEKLPITSEKSGTAAPSKDVKDDSKRALPPGVKAHAPDQVKP
jgi:hypothetical protein